MSRSRKKRKQAPKKRQVELLVSGNCIELEAKAQSALESGRYKDASTIYKALLKEERRDVWLAGLGNAYAARASDLAGKGMFKEALVIWEQREASCETALVTSNYIVWTLQAGDIDAAVKLYTNLQHTECPLLDRALIEEYFAAFALAGETRILDLLPAGDPVVRDHVVANALLMAFCHSDTTALETCLKAIPYRSPYRNFRQIIKAWLLSEGSPRDLPAAVNRIGKHSPFSGLASTLLELYTPECESGAIVWQEGLASTLKVATSGWSSKHVEFLKATEILRSAPNAKALFNLLVRFTPIFEESVARRTALKLLIHYPQGKHGFSKHFGKLSSLELAKLDAQMVEMEGDPYESDYAWREVLERQCESGPGADRLREALILRKLADGWLRYERNIYPQPRVVDDLSASLTLDPDDVATHVTLIDLQRKSDDLKGARASVKEALDRFPDNTAVLIEAVQTAIAGNAFKKAASIAQKILKLDPINIKVQGILLDAHLAHGRKQIKVQRFDLARRELLEAVRWARNPETEGRVKLISGLLEFSAKEAAYGQSLLKEGVELSGGGLVGQYQLLVEAEKLDLQGQNWLNIAKLPKASSYTSREHVMALIRAVGNTQGLEDEDIYGTLMPFDAAIRKSVKEPYTRQETELVCDTLQRYGLMGLLATFSQRALEQWPEHAVFVFHELYAKADGSVFKLNERECDRLDEAFERARDSGDSRTVNRMVDFMDPPDPFGFSPGFPPGMPHSFPDELAAMMDEVGPEAVEALLEAMERSLGERNDDLPLGNPGKSAKAPKPEKQIARRKELNPDQKELF